MTTFGEYWGSYIPYNESYTITDSARIQSVNITGDVLTIDGSLYFQTVLNSYNNNHILLPNQIYHFQLSEGTKFVERGFEDYYISRSEFKQNYTPGSAPCYYIVVENGIVKEVSVSS